MKIAFYSPSLAKPSDAGQPALGVVTDAGIYDVRRRTDADLPALLESADARQRLAESCTGAPDHALDGVTMLPPIIGSAKIICVGLNYHGHVRETGRDPNARPTLFTRFADSHVGHGSALIRPRVSEKFDFEGEIAIVIGKAGRHIDAADALRHVGGYSCYNDGSARDWQRHSSQFTPGKNFFASGSMGPWIVTADEVADPLALTVTTRLNGSVVQEGNLGQLIFDIPYLIAYISAFTPLRVGDVIATGTPEGVGMARTPPLWMAPGDAIEVEVSSVGVLRNTVAAEA